jgi:hypothetical protein
MCLRRAINLTQLGIQCAAGALNAANKRLARLIWIVLKPSFY